MSGKHKQRKRHDLPDRDPICIYEQETDVFLRLGGTLVAATGATGETGGNGEDRLLTINRDYLVTAEEDVLVVRATRLGAPEYRFDRIAIILAPDVRVCRRDNDCKQVVRFREQSAFIDVAADETLQLQACDFLFADDGEVVFAAGFLNRCDCSAENLETLLADAGAQADEDLDLPRAESFLIHLRRIDLVPVDPVDPVDE